MAKKNIYAKMAAIAIKSKSDEKESLERPKAIIADTLSKMIGTQFYISGKYEDWDVDDRGNRIRYSRYYPEKRLYVDVFNESMHEDEIDFRGSLVLDRGFNYLPIRLKESITMENIYKALKGENNGERNLGTDDESRIRNI